MFLIERIISLLAYAIVLFIACQLISRVKGKQYKVILLIYLIVLAVFAFNYKPYITADLYRLRQYIQYWIHMDWNEILRYASKSSSPTWVLYSYLVSKLNNENWLQTVAFIWCFGNIFYMISCEIERQRITGKNRGMLLFYVMAVGSFYLQVISGIRSMLGISIITFCFYRETLEHKSVKSNLILYLVAALLHSSTMILVVSRFLFLIIQEQKFSRRLLMFIAFGVIGLFSFYYFCDFVNKSFELGIQYLTNKNEYSYGWEILIGLLETVETIYILQCFKAERMKAARGMEGYDSVYLFVKIWSVICIVALPFSYAIFRRYTIMCTIVNIPLATQLLVYNNDRVLYKKRHQIILALSLAIFVLSSVRGDLCGFKLFVLM